MKTPVFFDSPFTPAQLQYCLCTSEKQFAKLLKELEVDEPVSFCTEGRDARVNFMQKSKEHIAAICIKPSKEFSVEQLIGLLAHEVMHVWQEILEICDEDYPGNEIEAYAVQEMIQALTPIMLAKIKK